MKTYLILIGLLAFLSANAAPPRNEGTLQTTGATTTKKKESLSPAARPNEIIKDNVSYSGIGVQLVKPGNPLQLVNPAAPARYGSAEDNTLRDPISGQVSGLKIFSIRF